MPLGPIEVGGHEPPRTDRLIVDNAQNAIATLGDAVECVNELGVISVWLDPARSEDDAFDPGKQDRALLQRLDGMPGQHE